MALDEVVGTDVRHDLNDHCSVHDRLYENREAYLSTRQNLHMELLLDTMQLRIIIIHLHLRQSDGIGVDCRLEWCIAVLQTSHSGDVMYVEHKKNKDGMEDEAATSHLYLP